MSKVKNQGLTACLSLYPNLPSEQRRVQRFVDQFNADEEHRRTMAVKRCLRRLRHRRLPPKRQKLLDLIDLLSSRPLQDCIGFLSGDEKRSSR